MDRYQMIEIWKPIKGYETYSVSNFGRVKNNVRDRMMKPIKNYANYLVVGLRNNRVTKIKRIHRLVAEAFIPNPCNKPEVNHLDEVKSNNSVENLEWATRTENANWGTATSRAHKKTAKPIFVKKDNFSNTFESITEFANEIGGTQSGVVWALKRNGKYKGFEVNYVKR